MVSDIVLVYGLSYLSNRVKYTMVDDHLSSPEQIRCGVPQGSILGPLLFICYINDLQQHCTDTKPYLYADDSALVCCDLDPNVISSKLQNDLNSLNSWFIANRLSVNCAKTKCTLFCSNRSRCKHNDMNLSLNDVNLEQVTEIKYLGLTIDQHLWFERHVDIVCSKVNVRTKLLWRVRSFIPRSLAKTLYQSLIYPHFVYCNFVIDSVSESLKNKLQCQQNAALRAVLNVDMAYPVQKLLTEVGVDSIRIDMMKASCKFVYKGFYNVGPPCLNAVFELYIPERDLRSGDELQIKLIKCNTMFGQKNLAYRGPLYWNALPTSLKASVSPDAFKKVLKSYNGFG